LKTLDPQGASRAIAACGQASALASQAFRRALAFNDAEREARIFALVVRAMRDLAALTDEREQAEEEKKPKRQRPYQWKPGW
jgi:hypothetical protein